MAMAMDMNDTLGGVGMETSMDMSDMDGQEIRAANGERLAVFNKFNGWPEQIGRASCRERVCYAV